MNATLPYNFGNVAFTVFCEGTSHELDVRIILQ